MIMANHKIMLLRPSPGIQRDGTQFDSTGYIDGEWVRFYKGKPRKIGGYQLLSAGTIELIRSLYSVKKSSSFDLYVGRESGVSFLNYIKIGAATPESSRTPAGYIPNRDNIWSFELASTNINGEFKTFIFAHVAPNADDISSTDEGRLYYGDINDDTPLLPVFAGDDPTTTPLILNGGVISVPPFLFAFGEGGVVAWSDASSPFLFPTNNIASIAGTKIVAGWRTRGSTVPTALFWSLNSIIKATFLGEDLGFSFNTIEDDITILSARSIVKFDQVYYWIGADQFYYYNGVVQSLPNTFSTDWFFNNVNQNETSKIFGISLKRYNEIWWFYPRGNNTECSHVIIYNVKENIWYDTDLPRSHAISSNLYNYPIMADSTTILDLSRPPNDASNVRDSVYGIWTHEKGNDKIFFNQNLAIRSFFETNIMDLFEQGGGDRQLRIRRIEPDFDQVGNMSVKIINRGFAQGDLSPSQSYNFSQSTSKIDTNEMGRLVSLQFTSNEQDGYYQMGKVILNVVEGDVRPKS